MSVSSGSDITIPIQDSPPPPPSPYANGGAGSKMNDGEGKAGVTNVSIVDSSEDGGGGKKTPEPRGDVTVTVGFVNEAYQDKTPIEEKKSAKQNGKHGKNGAISISVAGPGSGDKMDGEHTEIHLNEAVNPELINMNILNTIPDKPNPEFGPYDNLDEYFVPVNQHKKFLRSEKLYVTKDKRKESRWKKYVCWLIGATVLATIVTVAVLAGIGLIPQKSPNRYTDSVVGTTPPESPSSSTPTDTLISSSPESSLPSSSEINTPPSVPLDALYVPMTADVAFHITDLKYEPALNDNTSERFQELATEIQDEIKDILKTKVGLTTVFSRISKFEPGSVYVKMRIGWADQSVEFQKVKFMLSNVDTVGPYRIMPISTYDIVNLCRINLNGCSHNCSFDYLAMDFYCSCDENVYYLSEDKKTCMPLFEMSSSSTTTTSEEPLPEISSSASPEVESSSESSSEVVLPVDDSTHLPEQSSPEPSVEPEIQTTDIPNEHEVEQESSTESVNSSEIEPISHHHHPEDTIVLSSTSTTEATVEHVSKEVDHVIPIVAETTTTTTTTTEEPHVSHSSEEARSDLPEQQVPTTVVPEQEAETLRPVEEQQHSPTGSEELLAQPNPTEQVMPKEEEEITRTEARADVEIARPTEASAEQAEPEQPVSSENITATNLNEEHQVLPTQVVPSSEEIAETTLAPQQSEEQQPQKRTESVENQPISQEVEPKVDVAAPETVEATTLAEEEQLATTMQPQSQADAVKEVRLTEEDNQHHITPMDILNFSSEPSSTTPAATHAEIIVTTTAAPTIEEGRSFSSEISQNSSDTVENPVENSSVLRSQSLTEEQQSQSGEETATEGQNSLSSGDGVEDNTNRTPRRFSAENSGSVEQMISGDETGRRINGEREELLIPVVSHSQNVTESASVETADENPGTALVTSKSSSESDSREVVTQNTQPFADNNISGQSASSESGSSQESPMSESESVSGESISEETTTFKPKSLLHDVDINYIGNLTEDHSISEPAVEVETVLQNGNVGTDKEKLVVQSDNTPEPTTAPVEQENQDEAQTNLPPASSEVVVAVPPASSSSESREETTRGITSEITGEDDYAEFSNRDHRDTETDIETPSLSSSASAESEGSVVGLPTDIPTTTTEATLTTTTTTSTTTTTTPSPLPQELLAAVSSEIIATSQTTTSTTTTTTTVSPIVDNANNLHQADQPVQPDSHNNKTSITGSAADDSSSLSNESTSYLASASLENSSNNDGYSQESSSLEREPSSSASHEEASVSSSPSSEDHDNELT